MLYKYLVSVDEISVGLIYDDRKLQMRIGGNKLFSDFMNSIVETYAGLNLADCLITIDKMKIRYSIECTKAIFDKVGNEILKQGISIERVKSFNRLMR
jgi:hypothetical protein